MLCGESGSCETHVPSHFAAIENEGEVVGRLRPFPSDWRVTGPAKREPIVLPVLNILAFVRSVDGIEDRPSTPARPTSPYLDSGASTPAVSGPAEAHNFLAHVEGMSSWSNGLVLIKREP